MNNFRYWLRIVGLCLMALPAATVAHAQADNYPNKTVTIISDAAPGSTPDVDARFVAEGLGKAFGQQFIVVNHPGANGSIAAHAATEAVPDGYTLFMPALSTFVALPSVAPNLPLMLPRDFVPIGYTAENPMFVAVNPKLGVSTLPQLIALAKKEPGTISIAVTGVGRLTDLTGLLLQDRADVKLLPVPYTGGPAAALADVGSGRVSMIIEGYSGIVGAVKAGQVKLIAVASAERLPQFPDLPTVAETLPGFSATRLASPGRSERHARADRQQSERCFGQGGQRRGFQETPGEYRQLFARHDAGASAGLRRERAANLVADAAKSF